MMNELTRMIREWAIERNLDNAQPEKQMLKLIEEVGEIASAMARGDVNGVKDGIGDVQVVITILAQQSGTSIDECTKIAYDEIRNRKGQMVNGVFVKEEDLIDLTDKL